MVERRLGAVERTRAGQHEPAAADLPLSVVAPAFGPFGQHLLEGLGLGLGGGQALMLDVRLGVAGDAGDDLIVARKKARLRDGRSRWEAERQGGGRDQGLALHG